MKYVALDLGEARIGVAASDETGRLAFARRVVVRGGFRRDVAALRAVCAAERPDRLVVGLPLTAEGREGERAAAARALGQALGRELGLEVEFADERHSTEQALEELAQAGLDSRRARARVDAEAARIILQRHLDCVRGGGA